MKKIFLLFLSLLSSFSLNAQEPVTFVCEGFHNINVGHSGPKTPIPLPKVYIEDYTLTFVIDHPDYSLIIKDDNGNIVYTTTVYSSQTQVVLPSTLSGNYQIELVMGNWLFTGWIEL